jgi:hypothetical protein
MSSSFKLALLQCPDVTFQIESFYSHIYQVQSARDLVRLLIEKRGGFGLSGQGFPSKSQSQKSPTVLFGSLFVSR